VPEPIAALALTNKRTAYAILFRAAADTLRTIAADPRHLGAKIGCVAVLHTWGQSLCPHPHVHCVVPGGGLAPDGSRWVACRPGFFLPVRVLSRLFRRLFLDALQRAFDTATLRFVGTLELLRDPMVCLTRPRALAVLARPSPRSACRFCRGASPRLPRLARMRIGRREEPGEHPRRRAEVTGCRVGNGDGQPIANPDEQE
jgi:hypothetical protein